MLTPSRGTCFVLVRRHDGKIVEKVAVFNQQELVQWLTLEGFSLYGVFPCKPGHNGATLHRRQKPQEPQGLPEGKIFWEGKLIASLGCNHRADYQWRLKRRLPAFKAMIANGVDRRTSWKFAYTAAEW